MIGITREVLTRDFPVSVERITLDAGYKFYPANLTLDHNVEIPAKLTQKVVETLGARVPVAEQHATIGSELRHLEQTPLGLVQTLPVSLLSQRYPLELAGVGVGPAMEATGELSGIAAIGPAHLHTPMPTRVQKCSNRAVVTAADEDRIFTHIGRHVIAGLGDLRFVTEKQPAACKDALELRLIDLRIEEDLATDESLFEFDVSIRPLHRRVSCVSKVLLRVCTHLFFTTIDIFEASSAEGTRQHICLVSELSDLSGGPAV